MKGKKNKPTFPSRRSLLSTQRSSGRVSKVPGQVVERLPSVEELTAPRRGVKRHVR